MFKKKPYNFGELQTTAGKHAPRLCWRRMRLDFFI